MIASPRLHSPLHRWHDHACSQHLLIACQLQAVTLHCWCPRPHPLHQDHLKTCLQGQLEQQLRYLHNKMMLRLFSLQQVLIMHPTKHSIRIIFSPEGCSGLVYLLVVGSYIVCSKIAQINSEAAKQGRALHPS